MVQVPTCSCGGGGTAGGGGTCASIVVSEGYCADDATGRPLIVRNVVLCNGTVIAGIYELNGDEYVGVAKRCDLQGGGIAVCGCEYTTVGRQKVTVGGAAITLSPPANTDFAIIENIPIGSGRVRWTDDGVDPVGGGAAGSGHFLMPGTVISHSGQIDQFTMVRDTSTSGTVEVTYGAYV